MLPIIYWKSFHLILKGTLAANSFSSTISDKSIFFPEFIHLSYYWFWESLTNSDKFKFSQVTLNTEKHPSRKTWSIIQYIIPYDRILLCFSERKRVEKSWEEKEEGKRCANLQMEKKMRSEQVQRAESRKGQNERDGGSSELRVRIRSRSTNRTENWNATQNTHRNLHNRSAFSR